jgi:hypothetical protein
MIWLRWLVRWIGPVLFSLGVGELFQRLCSWDLSEGSAYGGVVVPKGSFCVD